MTRISRRDFIKKGSGALGLAAAAQGSPLLFLEPIPEIGNPLEHYPDRDWEKVYRDQYRHDSTFTFICDPNDTHACRLRAFVRNGIVIRVEQNYDADQTVDLSGNTPSLAWNPRGCLKGFTVMRRVYGPYRVKYPMVRKGFAEWVRSGFPDPDSSANKNRYFKRGEDSWLKMSWDEAGDLVARTLLYIMKRYSGEGGARLLRKEGYPEEMIEAIHGSGAQTIKLRAGMPLLGVTRIQALYRFANMLALYDGKYGARGWSNFDWHGDLPPGHPMVTGIQAFEHELNDLRNSKLLVFLGKNMVENKMPDAHWWIEIIERGGKVVNISPEYSPASQKADYWIPIRPGSDTALLLGISNLIFKSGKIDLDFVKRMSDMPFLVRMDNLKVLRAHEVFAGYKNKELTGYSVKVQKIKPELREKWGDFVVIDSKSGEPKVVTRDDIGEEIARLGIDPKLEGVTEIKGADGKVIKVKTVFELYRDLCAEYDPITVSEITQAPKELIERLAKDFVEIKPVSIHHGEGINHYFHCDLTTRAVFLPLILTGNLGKRGAGVSHWAGNYKSSIFQGLPLFTTEDPFNANLDPAAPASEIKKKKYWKAENPAFWNYGDRPLKVKGKNFTGKSHMPTPTKAQWFANVNFLNQAKWHYEMAKNVDPHALMIVYNEWEWTGSCEFADVVFPVQSWLELTQPDMTGSCSNPFIQIWKGGIPPLYDCRQDGEVMAGVADHLSRLTGDKRYGDYFKFFREGQSEVYIQRVLDGGENTKGLNAKELIKEEKAALVQFRTYPRIPGWEQVNESKPFYTKSGRLELYRDEDEFIEYGENLFVHREPVEATPYLPNVIVTESDVIRPNSYGIPLDHMGASERSVRNVKMPWGKVKGTRNPLYEQGYRFYCMTPKSRHRVHSSWAVCDWNLLFKSNFSDPRREDKRTPGFGEAQLHINPDDAKELGIKDGDYVWVDANPADRPYIGWKEDDPFYKVARFMLRARFNPAYPRGVVMVKHGQFMATPKSVLAHETRDDGRALSADTNYQATVRYGSQQSLVRGWLQPTMMTDSLARKNYYGQEIDEGYESDIHSPNTCPKETLVKITKAEDGGIGGKGIWKPATTGYTPGLENEDMKRYLMGEYIR